jgi:hypothetical protein
VFVTSSSGFVLRKVFYTVPSRLIGFRMQVRIYDDRLDCFVAQTLTLTLRRRRCQADGRRDHLVDYRHVIHSLRRKPMALLNLVYRDALFPRAAYRLAWEKLLADGDPRRACKAMVALLALAHDRGCEAELAAALTEQMARAEPIDLAALQVRFAPVPARMRDVVVDLPSVATHDLLLPSLGEAA